MHQVKSEVGGVGWGLHTNGSILRSKSLPFSTPVLTTKLPFHIPQLDRK